MASTSSLDTGAPPTRKNRRRSTPSTTTTSPAPHFATERRSLADHTEQSTQSTPGRSPSGLGTTTRRVHTASPLGRIFSSGDFESRPSNTT
ncbi:hypothetical protein ASD66_22305 [Nocardioides sp. Root151]|nr:hypothetical protein ASD30_17225 [Nocardioides sp. Root140]KQZ66281.1 hypothetical protein ASD66_22305 [Nocardioides sp. Root151]